MKLELNAGQAAALKELLEITLGDMSHEIAATDNAAFRAMLVARREALAEVAAMFRSATAEHTERDAPSELVRELMHPGA